MKKIFCFLFISILILSAIYLPACASPEENSSKRSYREFVEQQSEKESSVQPLFSEQSESGSHTAQYTKRDESLTTMNEAAISGATMEEKWYNKGYADAKKDTTEAAAYAFSFWKGFNDGFTAYLYEYPQKNFSVTNTDFSYDFYKHFCFPKYSDVEEYMSGYNFRLNESTELELVFTSFSEYKKYSESNIYKYSGVAYSDGLSSINAILYPYESYPNALEVECSEDFYNVINDSDNNEVKHITDSSNIFNNSDNDKADKFLFCIPIIVCVVLLPLFWFAITFIYKNNYTNGSLKYMTFLASSETRCFDFSDNLMGLKWHLVIKLIFFVLCALITHFSDDVIISGSALMIQTALHFHTFFLRRKEYRSNIVNDEFLCTMLTPVYICYKIVCVYQVLTLVANFVIYYLNDYHSDLTNHTVSSWLTVALVLFVIAVFLPTKMIKKTDS